MPAGDDEPLTNGRMLDKSRMEAFSDGVLAIAITLLVFEVTVRPPGSPLEQFLNAWPSYLAYVVSFLTIGAAWIGHHALTDRLERVDVLLLRLEPGLLVVVGFLPVPDSPRGRRAEEGRDAERVAAVVYGLTLLAIRLLFFLMDAYSRRAHLLASGVDDPDLDEERRKFGFVVAGYVITILSNLSCRSRPWSSTSPSQSSWSCRSGRSSEASVKTGGSQAQVTSVDDGARVR